MEIEEYYKILDEFAEECNRSELSPHLFIEDKIIKNKVLIDTLIDFRKDFLGSSELNLVSAYLSIGFFKGYAGVEREACFVLNFDLTELAIKLEWRQRCEVYDNSQPIFQSCPDLKEIIRRKESGSLDNELIDFSALTQIGESEIVMFQNQYFLIDYCLNPIVIAWAKEKFPGKPLYVRIKPYKVYHQQPIQRLFESILMPANPNWWKTLKIHNRMKEGASYLLDDCVPNEQNLQQYWELHIKNINRLEVIAKRNNNGNLSMMLEELTSIDKNGMLFGRCIHLDTDTPIGEKFEDAILNHLDLAINIYEDQTATQRTPENLANGSVTTDASYRTHLLRIEKVPF